jgi:cytochrome P450
MTTETISTSAFPSVFDAGLPSLDYLQAQDPELAHRAIADARRQAPIALGALGPEVLTYDLVRTVLRDPRFATAHRAGAEAQGIAAWPLWRRITSLILSIDGERHQRQRRLVAKAFNRRAPATPDRRDHHRAARPARAPGPVRCRVRCRRTVPDPGHLRTAGHTTR